MNEQKQSVNCSPKQWYSPEMEFNCFIDTKLTMQLLFPSPHWLFQVLQHFHGSYLKYSFFLAWRTEKFTYFQNIIPVILTQSATHPQTPLQGVDLFQSTVRITQVKQMYCMGLQLISLASNRDNYNMVVYHPASQCQKKKNRKFGFLSETVWSSLSRILPFLPQQCCTFCFLCREELRITTACFFLQ